MKRLFILGTGRCGTHSVAKALGQLPGIHSTHEGFPDARALSNLRWNFPSTQFGEGGLRLKDWRLIIDDKLSKFDQYDKWADSNCLLWNLVDLLMACHHGDRPHFIYIKRDKAATVDSMMRTRFYAPDSLPFEARATRDFIPFGPDYGEAERRKNCEFAYDVRTQQIEAAIDTFNPRFVKRIKFEEMIEANSGTFNDLMDFAAAALDVELPKEVVLPCISQTQR